MCKKIFSSKNYLLLLFCQRFNLQCIYLYIVCFEKRPSIFHQQWKRNRSILLRGAIIEDISPYCNSFLAKNRKNCVLPQKSQLTSATYRLFETENILYSVLASDNFLDKNAKKRICICFSRHLNFTSSGIIS